MYLGEADDSWESRFQAFQPNIAGLFLKDASRQEEYFIWTKAEPPSVPISLSASPFLIDELIRFSKSILASSNQIVGGANANSNVLAKMLGYAVADQRLTACSGYNTHSDMPCMNVLWNAIHAEPLLKDVESQIFTSAKALGFEIQNDQFHGDPNVMTFVLNRPSSHLACTPGIKLSMQVGTVSHSIEALNLEELDSGKVKISCYIPTCISAYGAEEVMVHLWMKAPTNMGSMTLPGGQSVLLSETEIREGCLNDQKDLMSSIFMHSQNRVCDQGPLKIDTIQETKTEYSIKLLFTEETKSLKLKLDESTTASVGLEVGPSKMRFTLPLPIKVVSVKIHRKSMFVMLNLKKLCHSAARPYISLNGFKPTFQITSPDIGSMFSEQIMSDVKHERKLKSSLSKADQILYELKDSVQIFFKYCFMDKYKLCAISSSDLGVFGMVLFHSGVLYPPLNSTYAHTPMIDASFSFFDMKDVPLILSIKSHFTELPNLLVEKEEMGPIKRLFEIYKASSCDQSVHAQVKKFKASKIFHRCAITPLYALPTAAKMEIPGLESMRKSQQQKNDSNKRSDRDLADVMRAMKEL